MPPRVGLFRALPLLCCLLTASASGDDFCLPRLIFGAAQPGSARLPLDDPNSDFLEPSAGPADGSSWRSAFDDALAPLFCVATPLEPLASDYPSSQARHLAVASCYPPIPQPTIPLRC
jgi:hypothetical protein